MNKEVIVETYSRAAQATDPSLCCAVDYRVEFEAEELQHIPDAVLDRNYGCGVPLELRTLTPGKTVLDLGPGMGRDCFIAASKVGPSGKVYGLDMNPDMLAQARSFSAEVAQRLGYQNIEFLEGQFDIEIPLGNDQVDVIFSNCVNNLALDKETAYREMLRVLQPGSKLSFSDIVSYEPIPDLLRSNSQAWADCSAGVLSFDELNHLLTRCGFLGTTLTTDYLWKQGDQLATDYFSDRSLSEEELKEISKVRLYAVLIEAFKPVVDPNQDCFFKGQFAIYHGPGTALQLDQDSDHVFRAGEPLEVCEKTASILKAVPFSAHFTVFEPAGEVESRLCIPGGDCC